ncbi:hypothetical protein [Paenibacillus abyssi]|uniref:Uncharacterized protein n=1 Tax=Paenibacillus abyssi TaxID=1340531 RepID=A0A917D737_9BACL|nr:hypothetical protein [Paenibacillus abyssi]GGG13325.1 hypothetical protein GCM10010916_32850 [Paenibacillus abyssi]
MVRYLRLLVGLFLFAGLIYFSISLGIKIFNEVPSHEEDFYTPLLGTIIFAFTFLFFILWNRMNKL